MQFGYAVSRISELQKFKKEIEQKKQRFVSKKNNKQKDIHERLSTRESDRSTELQNIEAEPEWTAIHKQNNERIKEIKQLIRELTKISNQRIKIQFGNMDGLDNQIYEKSQKVKKLLQECKQNLKKIENIQNSEDININKIKRNISKNIAMAIQEQALAFRKQQKHLYESLKKYNNVKNQEVIDPFKEDVEQEQDLAQDEIYSVIVNERDGQINQLVDTINQLSEMFQQMQSIVQEQGTVLDRIDFNIQETVHNVQKVNKKFTKLVKHQESSFVKIIIIFLMVTIIIETGILAFKWI